MKKIIILFIGLLFAGCARTEQPAPAATPEIKKSAPVLRDPFRPDHPTRGQIEAEKERKELDEAEKKERK